MKTTNRLLGLALAAGGVLGLALGCAKTPLEENYGSSLKGNAAAITVDPEAGKTDSGPIEGMDPVTGEVLVESYVDGQRAPEQDDNKLFLISQ